MPAGAGGDVRASGARGAVRPPESRKAAATDGARLPPWQTAQLRALPQVLADRRPQFAVLLLASRVINSAGNTQKLGKPECNEHGLPKASG